MLLTHLGLLFSAAFWLSRCFKGMGRWFFIGVLFFPPIFSHSGFIVKDVSFTLSYLFCISLLTFYTIQKKPLTISALISIFLILFYGTAVKYQAIFLLPLLSFWIAYCMNPLSTCLKIFIKGMGIWGFLWGAIILFNAWAVPQKDHAWQYVKLYDLAAISLETGEDLIPAYSKSLHFSKEALTINFNPVRVDELVFPQNALLVKGKNDEERNHLWHTWFDSVLKHPKAYLKHRYRLSKNLLTLSPIKSFHKIQSNQEAVSGPIKKMLYLLEDLGIMEFLQLITSFYIYIPCVFLYMGLGWFAYRRTRTPYGISLFMMNSLALCPILVLFVFSMASDAPRYLYISACCFHLSHPFMLMCWKSLRKSNTLRVKR